MNYNFNSIAGYETEKEELKKLCDIFINRKKYEKKGAKLPKGIIFYGAAGTGKTLFAKVMADVCGLQVFKIDLGDVENESAICRHIKKTFLKAAKHKEPTMIFFDEMDKVLPNDMENYHTDRSKTILTQLLTLIDGMTSAENIVFVATCNDYDALPETLTRPGRLDKKIAIGIPTNSSRIKILKMYMQKSSCKFEMSTEDMAKLCAGFSCASLETFINECILQSDEDGFISEKLIRERLLEIKNEDIPRARSTVDDTVCACRNVGAFIVAKTFNDGRYVLSLDSDSVCNDFFNGIISEYDDDDDYDYDDDDDLDFDCDDDDDCDDDNDDCGDEWDDSASCTCYSKNDLINAITVLLGGYVAEELVLHKIYDNVSSYLAAVNNILFDMSNNGMFGLNLYYSSYRNNSKLAYTSERLENINKVFDETIQTCYEQAKEILVKNEDLLKKLIAHLVQKQILQAKECELLIADQGGLIL